RPDPRRSPMRLLGPLFRHDLVRAARRQRLALWRAAFGLVLLGALCCFYAASFPESFDSFGALFTPPTARGRGLAVLGAGFLALALTVVSTAALGMACSVTGRTPRAAGQNIGRLYAAYFILSYALAGLPTSWANFPSLSGRASPVTLGDLVEWFGAGNPLIALYRAASQASGGRKFEDVLAEVLGRYAAFHLLLAVGCCVLSVTTLRR